MPTHEQEPNQEPNPDEITEELKIVFSDKDLIKEILFYDSFFPR